MNLLRCGGLLNFLLIATCLAGCGGDCRNAIEGKVQLDGQPIHSGTIRFVPVEGGGTPEGSLIVDGSYSLHITPGRYRIHIQGYKVVGQKHYHDDPAAPLLEVTESIVPDKYDKDSQEVREISSGSRRIDFDLNS